MLTYGSLRGPAAIEKFVSISRNHSSRFVRHHAWAPMIIGGAGVVELSPTDAIQLTSHTHPGSNQKASAMKIHFSSWVFNGLRVEILTQRGLDNWQPGRHRCSVFYGFLFAKSDGLRCTSLAEWLPKIFIAGWVHPAAWNHVTRRQITNYYLSCFNPSLRERAKLQLPHRGESVFFYLFGLEI